MLNAKNFGLAGGILWGLSLFLMTLLAHLTGYGTPFLRLLESVYPGYSLSLGGALLGLIYGFIDGFVGLFLLAWLYNWLNRRT
jgi:hypothetical protein